MLPHFKILITNFTLTFSVTKITIVHEETSCVTLCLPHFKLLITKITFSHVYILLLYNSCFSWASVLYENCSGLVKQRTVLTNYAPVYAVMEYMYGVFKPVYDHLGYSWEDFQEFARTVHAEQMQILHVETDHAESYVRRYCLGLLDWALKQNLQKRLQHLRMVNTRKIKCGYALGVAPAGEGAMKQMKGAILPLVKQHVVAIGGRVDSPEDHVTIALLKDSFDLPEEVEEVTPQGEWSVNKRGILIPGDALPSSLWLELCKALNQTDKFGSVDDESPTGMSMTCQDAQLESSTIKETPLESTGNSRKSLGLRLDFSSILPSFSGGKSSVITL